MAGLPLTVDAAVDGRVQARLEVAAGRTLGLVGPNGAGKSTTLALIAGLLRPDSGSIRLGDQVLAAASPRVWTPPHLRRVATLTQDPLLFPHLTVRDNVAFAPRALGAGRSEARRRADEWLDRFGLVELADRLPQTLSGGQAARVALARALAGEPAVMLLDEPLAAVDASIRPSLRQTVREALADTTAIVVSHDLLDIALLTDEVVVLDSGMVAETATTGDFLTSPRSDFGATLTGLNLVRGRWDGRAVVRDDGLAIAGEVTGGAGVAGAGVAVVGSEGGAGAQPQGAEVVGGGPEGNGPAALAVFRPNAVSVFTAPPEGSLRNVVHVKVESVEPYGDRIRLRAGGISADITPAAAAELHLLPDTPVYLGIKATEVAIHLTSP